MTNDSRYAGYFRPRAAGPRLVFKGEAGGGRPPIPGTIHPDEVAEHPECSIIPPGRNQVRFAGEQVLPMNPCVRILALVLVFGLPPAGLDAAEPAAAQPSPQEAAVNKVEKLIASTRNRMNDYQKEEMELEMASLKAQQAASQGVKGPAYRNVMLAAAREWQGFAERFSGLGRTLKTLVAERPNVPANLQAEIDSLILRFNQKNRSLHMKAVDLYERAAEYRSAMAVCMALYRDIPEDKRAGEGALKDRIAALCEKCGDNATALTIVKGIVDARPEEDRYKDIKLSQRLGGLYEKAGDLKNALDVYKRALNAIPADKRARAGAALEKKIAAVEKKLGNQPK
jgi:tetratricopeptide (TPR) repeat protein